MAYVLKVKYENSLRRLTLPNSQRDVCFSHLEHRIRELLQLPSSAQLAVSYLDNENDIVTMASDQDVMDALILQGLNPLRLYVTLVHTSTKPSATAPGNAESRRSLETDEVDVALKRIRGILATAPDSLKEIVQQYELLFEGVTSRSQIPAVLEKFFQKLAAQCTSAIAFGAAAVTALGNGAATGAPLGTSSQPNKSSEGCGSTGGAGAPAVPPLERLSVAPSLATNGDLTSAAGARAAASLEMESEASSQPSLTGDNRSVARLIEDITALTPVVHGGITCDVCGAFPIMGTRWKSIRRNDYDLCSKCFESEEDAADYIKIEKSLSPPYSEFPDLRNMMHMPHPPMPHPMCAPQFYASRMYGMRRGHGRPYGPFGPGGSHSFGGPGGKAVDARLVCDITMYDGSEIAPGQPFTKTWRLRNTGAFPWPAMTNLEHVGGNALGQASRVLLRDVPPEGLAPEQEMLVSVDLVAPKKPGRYVSFWRLASPMGNRFGSRLSALVQVRKETAEELELAMGASSTEDAEELPKEESQAGQLSANGEPQAPLPTLYDERPSTLQFANDKPQAARQFSNDNLQAAKIGVNISAAAVNGGDLETNLTEETDQQKMVLNFLDLGEEHSLVHASEAADSGEKIPQWTLPGWKREERESEIKSTTIAAGGENNSPRIAAGGVGNMPYWTLPSWTREEQVAEENSATTTSKENMAPTSDLEERRIAYPTLEEVLCVGPVKYPTIFNNIDPVPPKETLESKVSASSTSSFPTPEVEPVLYPTIFDSPHNTKPSATAFDSMYFDDVTKVPSVLVQKEVPASKALLARLEAMGFSDSQLNIELLEKNNMDLRRTLDDLCTADEWEPFIAELEEMGFQDVALNRRLMFKNNGSVKRVVKELVQMYRDVQAKTVKVE